MAVTIVAPEPNQFLMLDDYLFGIFGLEVGQEITIVEQRSDGEQSTTRIADAEGTVHTTFPVTDSPEITLFVLDNENLLAKSTFKGRSPQNE